MEKLSSQSPSKNLPKIEITSSSIITDDTVTTTTPHSTTPTPIDPHKWDAFAYGCLITVCIGVLCFFSCMAYKKHADYYSFQVTYSTYCIKGNKYSFVFLHFVLLIRNDGHLKPRKIINQLYDEVFSGCQHQNAPQYSSWCYQPKKFHITTFVTYVLARM